MQACLKSASLCFNWGMNLQSSQDFEALWRSKTCGKLSGLLVLCPLLLICDDWKQVTAHLTACVLWYSCYAESSTCKHLHDSCLPKSLCGPHVAFRQHFHNPLCAWYCPIILAHKLRDPLKWLEILSHIWQDPWFISRLLLIILEEFQDTTSEGFCPVCGKHYIRISIYYLPAYRENKRKKPTKNTPATYNLLSIQIWLSLHQTG